MMEKLTIHQKESIELFFALLEENSIEAKTEYISNTKKMFFLGKDCGHSFEITPASLKARIKKNKPCPKCSSKNIKLTFSEIKEIISKTTQKEYKLVSKEKDYTNTRCKIEILHKSCGLKTEITYKNFSLGKRCRHCAAKSSSSKAALLLGRLLKQVNIDFIDEKTFDNCINPISGQKLPFDFYIEKLNLAIEIDGEQHFIPVEQWGGDKSLKATKYRDFLKDQYCVENNIELLRIPLINTTTLKKYSYDEMKRIIFNFLYDISLRYYNEAY